MNKRVKDLLIRFWPYMVCMVVAVILISYQIQKHTTIIVADSFFHFSRFYDAAEQIKNHNFSYFQMNYGFNQTGRIINGLYGPFFAYLMGGILLLVKTWFNFQILTTFLISFISSVGMYLCSKKITNNQVISTLVAIIYMTQVKFWSNGSTFTSISSMLMPFVLLCGIRMITNQNKPINWFQLALIMSIVSQIHVLSIILSIILLIPFFVAGLLKANSKRKMCLNLFYAIVATILLTINVWSSLFSAKFLDNLFNPISENMTSGTLSIRHFTILTIIIYCYQVIYVIINRKKYHLNTFITSLAVIFGILSSKIFPWKIVQNTFPILKETFQFPRRISVLFIPLMLIGIALTAAELLKNDSKYINLGIVVLLSLMFLSNYNRTSRLNSFYTVNTFMLNTKENHRQIAATRSKNLGELFDKQIIVEPDYLPKYKNISSKKAEHIYEKILTKSKNKFRYEVLTKGSLKISWKGTTSKKVTLPLVMYSRSRLLVNDQKINDIHKNEIGMPKVKQIIGENNAILSFKGLFLFKFCLIITLINWMIFAVLYISFTFKKVRVNKIK